MSEKGCEVVTFMEYVPTAYSYNTVISSIKLDEPKTYLIWSWQCTVYIQSRKLVGYVTGEKEQSKPNNPNSEQWVP